MDDSPSVGVNSALVRGNLTLIPVAVLETVRLEPEHLYLTTGYGNPNAVPKRRIVSQGSE